MENNKQTALQELKSKLQEHIDKSPIDSDEQEVGYTICLKHVITIIDEIFLPKEREQIITAMQEGIKYGSDALPQTFDYPAERYYSFTYGKK